MEDIIENIGLEEDGDLYEDEVDTFGEIDVEEDEGEGDEVLTESYDDEEEDF